MIERGIGYVVCEQNRLSKKPDDTEVSMVLLFLGLVVANVTFIVAVIMLLTN